MRVEFLASLIFQFFEVLGLFYFLCILDFFVFICILLHFLILAFIESLFYDAKQSFLDFLMAKIDSIKYKQVGPTPESNSNLKWKGWLSYVQNLSQRVKVIWNIRMSPGCTITPYI